MSPLDWISALLAIDADASNHGETPEFAAISAVALRHNKQLNPLDHASPVRPMHRRKPGRDVDPRPWRQGVYAAMRLNLSAWAPLLGARNVNHGLLLPILLHCRDDHGRLGPPRSGRETKDSLRDAYAIVRRRSRLAATLDASPVRARSLIMTWNFIPVTFGRAKPPARAP